MCSSIRLADLGHLLDVTDASSRQINVAKLLGRRQRGFPGAQPVAFCRKHFHNLEHNDYMVCEKTDGLRCLLYLTQDHLGRGAPVQRHFLIDRKNKYYAVETMRVLQRIDDENGRLHQGTILDGELVHQCRLDGNSSLVFIVFDCLALNGTSVVHERYASRRKRLEVYVFNPWQAVNKIWPRLKQAQPFEMELKQVLPCYHVKRLLSDVILNLPHRNDGLIFVCKNSPYTFGTDPDTLKWKEAQDNTIDFRLNFSNDPAGPECVNNLSHNMDGKDDDEGNEFVRFQLHVHCGAESYQYYADMRPQPAESRYLLQNRHLFDGVIIECYRDAEGSWRPKLTESGIPRCRPDKAHGNHISIVDDILQSIQDGVDAEELVTRAVGIELCYGKRSSFRVTKSVLAREKKTPPTITV